MANIDEIDFTGIPAAPQTIDFSGIPPTPEMLADIQGDIPLAISHASTLGIDASEALENQNIINEEIKGRRKVNFFNGVKESWRIGNVHKDIGLLRAKQLSGDFSEETENAIKAMKSSLPSDQEYPEEFNLVQKSVFAASEMLPITLHGAKEGLKRGSVLGIGAGGMALAAGQIPPFTAAPEEIITVPTAAAGMFAVGTVSKGLEEIVNIEAGLAYDEILDFEDADGNKVNQDLAKSASVGIGVVNGLIEVAQVKLLLNTIPGGKNLLRGIIRDKTKDFIKNKKMLEVVRNNFVGFGTFLAAETAQEVAQESTNILVGEVVKELNNRLEGSDIKPATIEEISNRLLQTAKQSAMAFSVLGLPGTSVKTVTEAIKTGEEAEEKYIHPVKPETKETFQTELDDSYQEQKNSWIGVKNERILKADVEKQQLQKSVKKAAGVPKFDDTAKDMDKAIQIYIDLKQNPEHLEQYYNDISDEQRRIVDLSQNLPVEALDIADEIQNSYGEIGLEAMDNDVISNVMENYAGRIWDIEKSGDETRTKFKTKTRHARQRVFGSILEGWATGMNLKVEGATSSLRILKEEIIKTIENKRFIENLKRVKDIDGNPLITTKQIEGYQEITHPNFSVWEYAGQVKVEQDSVLKTGATIKTRKGDFGTVTSVSGDGKQSTVFFKDTAKEQVFNSQSLEVVSNDKWGKNFFVTSNGTIMERRRLFAPKKQAKSLNNILGESALNRVPGVKTITKYNAIVKAWVLQSSLFHHFAFLRSFYLGTNKKTWAEMNFVDAYKNGLESITDFHPDLYLGVRSGLTLGLRQDWQEQLLQEKTVIGRILDKTEATKTIKDMLLEFREMQADFLFGELGAGLKAKSFLIEFRNEMALDPKANKEEVAERVANLINEDFGGLNLERLERNPTLQHIFRLFALAPDWTESNIRTMVKVFGNAKGSQEEINLYRKFWAGILVKGLAATALANFLLAGGDLDEMIKNYERAWKEGNFKWAKVDITPIYKLFGGKTSQRKYFSILGHFQDPAKFITHPIKSAKHKGSIVFAVAQEALTGTDWSGKGFTTFEELIDDGALVKYGSKGAISYEQFPSYVLSQVIGSQPVQVQNFLAWQSGEMEGFDAIANSLGLGVTSTYQDKRFR